MTPLSLVWTLKHLFLQQQAIRCSSQPVSLCDFDTVSPSTSVCFGNRKCLEITIITGNGVTTIWNLGPSSLHFLSCSPVTSNTFSAEASTAISLIALGRRWVMSHCHAQKFSRNYWLFLWSSHFISLLKAQMSSDSTANI